MADEHDGSPPLAMSAFRSSRSVESPSTSATTSGASGYFIFRSQYPMMPNPIVMKTSSMLLLSEYDPMIEMTTMNGVMIAYGVRMIIASSGTASEAHQEREKVAEVDARDEPHASSHCSMKRIANANLRDPLIL